jgi:hypothetical protein
MVDFRRVSQRKLLSCVTVLVLLGSPSQKTIQCFQWIAVVLVTDTKSVSHWMFCGCSVSEKPTSQNENLKTAFVTPPWSRAMPRPHPQKITFGKFARIVHINLRRGRRGIQQ